MMFDFFLEAACVNSGILLLLIFGKLAVVSDIFQPILVFRFVRIRTNHTEISLLKKAKQTHTWLFRELFFLKVCSALIYHDSVPAWLYWSRRFD